jgi:DNA mismatch repair protein MutS
LGGFPCAIFSPRYNTAHEYRKRQTPLRKTVSASEGTIPGYHFFSFASATFTETSDEDAEIAARNGLVLTSRPIAKGVRVPMAGVPYHAAESYIARSLKKGIAWLSPSRSANRQAKVDGADIERVVTPGTLIEPTLLDEKTTQLSGRRGDRWGRAGIAYAEISTGEYARHNSPTMVTS